MIDMNVPKFIMLCGLPASGKSTKAKELAKEYNATIYSSDALREEMFGDVNDQGHNQELFTELHKRIKDCLRDSGNAIMDCTNINYKRRMAFLAELKNIPCEKICVLMATPYEWCLKRNAERERKVPEEAHYYNHERVGSYNSLFYEMACYNLRVAVIIRWHMQPYFWEKDNNEKLHSKYRRLWGEDLWHDIVTLHDADKAAH